METEKKFTQTLTFKAIIVAWLALMLLIPGAFVRGLIEERQEQSKKTVAEINEQWSRAQTIAPPVLVVPYIATETKTVDDRQVSVKCERKLYITPEEANIKVALFPETRRRSIYQSIVYKSDIQMNGRFEAVNLSAETYQLNKAYLMLDISDLRGISEEIEFTVNGKKQTVKASADNILDGKSMIIPLNNDILANLTNGFDFNSTMKLKGSGQIDVVPMAKNTQVNISGKWIAPQFVGKFLPDYEIDEKSNRFEAKWTVLGFNRNIPDTWTNASHYTMNSRPVLDESEIIETEPASGTMSNINFGETSFGVNLVETVDHYQKNMRSAKYALMFIALTFTAFFFVEVLTKKRIHFIQYLLVGTALVLFYTLLLSASEQIGFAWAYLLASAVTISLIVAYTQSIVKRWQTTAILSVILVLLYTFLFVVLHLESMALLIGSLFLFLILGIVMFVSRKIEWDRISLPKI